jgi:BTB/POZ domain-containing protein 9
MREEGTELTIPPSQFATDMSVLIGNDVYSDVTFIVQGERIPAHKALLNKRCSYFERLFESDFKEKQQVRTFELLS